ncbi:ribosome maturation factor RimM [Microbacterium amylolyticum]|uniref:Ribosome maturation factor RimM n=1 Tax=Microbacterium amylolyticum TaxID=936337 RepID=A0ABS4ZDU8_9MICO|nr:ribosome maturation factor RimM [Microbacterium amylolyticum]MBP2435460.1 16S rRNA processing protein RimM [Microbacterium amylolyticum]
MTTAKVPKNQLRVARVLKAHGLKGALKLELYTDDPDGRFTPGATFTLQVPEHSKWHRKTVVVSEFRWMNQSPIIFFSGVEDRTEAESLVRAILWVDHQEDQPSDEPEAWYDHQLIGLDAVRDGTSVGRIIRVEHLPAQDLLIIGDDNRELMVPFVQAIVPEVDLAAGRVILTPPPGLLEDLEEDHGAEQA